MPDLLAGSKVTALDTPPTVEDTEATLFTTTSITFAVTGEPSSCGTTFVAPTTGRVVLSWGAFLSNSGAGATFICPAVRVGSTVGTGASVYAANADDSARVSGTNSMQLGRQKLVSDLTPGDTYNVRLEHAISSGTGSITRRNIIVQPAT